MITYEVDKADIRYVLKKLKGIETKAPRVFKNAVNHTAKAARKKMAAGAQESYTVKSGGFNSRMKIQNATVGNLSAVIRSQDRTLTITRFHTTVPKYQGIQAERADYATKNKSAVSTESPSVRFCPEDA